MLILAMLNSFESSFKRANIMFNIIWIIATLISVAIFVTIICLVVYSLKKQQKINKDLSNENDDIFEQIKDNLSHLVSTDKEDSYTCTYCGSKFDKKLNKCPNCGAGKKEKK